jgi:hypothetical protein
MEDLRQYEGWPRDAKIGLIAHTLNRRGVDPEKVLAPVTDAELEPVWRAVVKWRLENPERPPEEK